MQPAASTLASRDDREASLERASSERERVQSPNRRHTEGTQPFDDLRITTTGKNNIRVHYLLFQLLEIPGSIVNTQPY